jgi:hypothetical protein
MAKSNAAGSAGRSTASEHISIADLMDQLRAAPPPQTVFIGMVKLCEDDADALMFAYPGDCDRWVKIPCSQVESVEKLPAVVCADHHHQGVRLFMKRPSSAEGKAFADLAHLHRTKLGAVQVRPVQGPASAGPIARQCIPFPQGGCPPGMHHTIDIDTGADICCPD